MPPPPCILLGIRMDDDTITISASIRLGLAFCLHHPCSQCGAHIDELALPGLSCRKSPGCHSRHNAKNDIHRTLAAAGVPCQMESHGLSRDDGKRPDGVTLLHWKGSTPWFGMLRVQTHLTLPTFTLPLQGLVMWLNRLRYASQESIDIWAPSTFLLPSLAKLLVLWGLTLSIFERDLSETSTDI
jgi:hypothetical protein